MGTFGFVMRRISAAIAATLLAALCQGCATERPLQTSASNTRDVPAIAMSKPAREMSPEELSALKVKVLALMEVQRALQKVLFTAAVDSCYIETGGVCRIPVEIIRVTGSDGTIYCAARAPEKVTLADTASADERTLVWSMTFPESVPADTKYYFLGEKDHGALVVRDDDKQIYNGKLGDGSGGPADPQKWNAKSKHNTRKSESVYVPVVLQDVKQADNSIKTSLCGTPDPRIAND